MSYDRLPYQPYDDANQIQPYPVGYQDPPPYTEDYIQPYDPYPYPVSAYPPDYRNEAIPPPERRDSAWTSYPRDYPRGGAIDYNEGIHSGEVH
jgi:hypothetical protein